LTVTVDLPTPPLNLVLEGGAQRAAGDRERDRDADVAAVDFDAADHVQLGHRAAQLGVDHAFERAQDRIAVRLHPRTERSNMRVRNDLGEWFQRVDRSVRTERRQSLRS
jgi:hypothetical protein